jgi:hypothetical protein
MHMFKHSENLEKNLETKHPLMMLEKIRWSRGRRWVVAGGHYPQRPGVSDRVRATQTARALRKSRKRAKRYSGVQVSGGQEGAGEPG